MAKITALTALFAPEEPVCGLKFRGLLDFLPSSVQPPDGEIQHGGKTDPGQVRHKQQTRHQ